MAAQAILAIRLLATLPVKAQRPLEQGRRWQALAQSWAEPVLVRSWEEPLPDPSRAAPTKVELVQALAGLPWAAPVGAVAYRALVAVRR